MAAGRVAGAALVLALWVAGGRGAAAQSRSAPVQAGVRVDVLAARITALQTGLELSLPAGRNLRLALVGAAGASWKDGASGASARLEATGRFLLDPDFQRGWAPYAAGGVGARYDRVGRWQGVLSLVLGMEGPRWGGVVPFVEAGWGGGARVGAGLRRSMPGRR